MSQASEQGVSGYGGDLVPDAASDHMWKYIGEASPSVFACSTLMYLVLGIVGFSAYGSADETERNSSVGSLILAASVIYVVNFAVSLWVNVWDYCFVGHSRGVKMFFGGVRFVISLASVVMYVWMVARVWGDPCDDPSLEGFICSYTTFIMWYALVSLSFTAFYLVVALLVGVMVCTTAHAEPEVASGWGNIGSMSGGGLGAFGTPMLQAQTDPLRFIY